MFTSVDPSLASLRSSFAGLTLSSSQHQQKKKKKKKKEINGIAQDLEDAERNWEWIQAVLADAEEWQIDDGSVREWLRDLRRLAYQIEDLRDVYAYEVVAREVQASKKAPSSSGDASTSKMRKVEVRSPSLSPLLDDSFRKQIAVDLGKIKKEFDAMAKRREALHLKESDGKKHSSNDSNSRREATGHLSVAPVCHGRDGDLQQLRDLLIADHGDGRMNFEVIAVIGMGGMGKTTLAQYVLKDPQVVGNFVKIGWVHVSETFDVIRLTKDAIESFSKQKCYLSGLSPLQDTITELIKDKKVLLVADDVWKTEGWESFVTPFLYGAGKGSKILVTTRFCDVADETRAVKSIELKRLSEEHGWSLLKEHAFPYESDDVDNAEELEEIGKRIVTKCGGLPLSIKLLGSLLSYKKNDEKEWRSVMESNLLDPSEGSEAKKKILGSLHLSYLHLSPKLQSCFKCCSQYRKDAIMPRRLKHSWVAYDLVKDQKEADRCLYELQSRSFLEIEGKFCEKIIMHDHIYDLAQYAKGEEHMNMLRVHVDSWCWANVRTWVSSFGHFRIRELTIDASCMEFTSCDDRYQDLLKCLRLLYLDRVEWSSIPVWVFRLYNLRYLSLRTPRLECLPDSVCDLRNLRGLSILGFYITYVPEAISRLTNLQELDLSGCSNLKYLPKTISKLVNLQELKLKGCGELEGLPEGIIHLTNLRILDLHGTRLSFLPRGFGALTELKYLEYQVANSTKGAGLAELKNMRYLEYLEIHNLCDIVEEEDASRAELDKKKHLCELHLTWVRLEQCVIENEEKIAHDHDEQVLTRLRPHRNLEELEIKNYRGFKLPSWMGDESFTKLVRLELLIIKYCTSLSPIDQLPSLEKLELHNMDSLKEVVPEHNGGHVDSDSMDSATEQRLSFPMLRKLYIWRCKSIELLPLRKLTSLVYVGVYMCENLEHMEPPYHIPLRHITIDRCPRFHFSPDPHFPKPSWKLIVQEEEEIDGFPVRFVRPWHLLRSRQRKVEEDDKEEDDMDNMGDDDTDDKEDDMDNMGDDDTDDDMDNMGDDDTDDDMATFHSPESD